MKRYTSKALVFAMMATLAVGAAACSTKTISAPENVTTESSAQMANPVLACTPEDIGAEFGITFRAPDGATDVRYSIIGSGDEAIAQMDFTLDGKAMCLRAKRTDITNINEAANSEDASKSADISGLFYDWTYIGVDQVYDYPAVVRISDEKAGYIGWLDVVPGILYNLSMTEEATPEDLAKYANMAFVPYDGEESSVETELQLANCFDTIYETKAGTPGSAERVSEAAKQFRDYIGRYDEDIDYLERAVDVTEYAMDVFEESHPDMDLANFKECFDAVVSEVKSTDPNVSEMDTFKCLVRAMELHMEDAANAK